MRKVIVATIFVLLALVFINTRSALAIPQLQLGDGSQGTWVYDGSSQTWFTNSDPFKVNTTALTTAWDTAGSADGNRYAYLVLASVPMSAVDNIDVTVTGASLVTSGYGAPPVEDPNSPGAHGIFDSWFEVYEFQFDGDLETIANTQPGDDGTDLGYSEEIMIEILALNTTGIHIDLFTVTGDGRYTPPVDESKKLVKAFAPYSHDAEYAPPAQAVPEPGTLLLLGSGLGLLGLWRWRNGQSS